MYEWLDNVTVINLKLLYCLCGIEIKELHQCSASAKTKNVHVKTLLIVSRIVYGKDVRVKLFLCIAERYLQG